MKKLFVLTLMLSLVIKVADAQSANANEEDLIRKTWGIALQELTASALQLNQEEADKFWPIWKQYREERKTIVDTKLKYIADYADNYENMTNEKAAEIITGLLKNEQKLGSLKSKYFKKIKKALSAIRAAQFIQVEASVDNELRASLTQNLPLVPDPKQ
ncbi:MAG: hypothetical protein ACTHLE_17485 [Agriterribacter sp.]